MKTNPKRPQISTTVDEEVYNEIKDMAEKDRYTMSQMAAILLEQAVKNRLRKRKNAKENNP